LVDDPALETLPAVARAAIRARLEGRGDRPPRPLGRRGPVFVTLRIDGALRGCMGDLEARYSDLAAETADRALAAAFGDPRFPPLEADELGRCRIDVTILGPLETASPRDLDPAVFGIEVSDDAGRRAVLLPGLEGVETVAEQVDLTRRKAEIPPGTPLRIRRFRATRVEER
jgi:AmmeMemoRadiSam system protein A